MKIHFGITKSNFGGAQRYVFDLATALKEAGEEVKVISGLTDNKTLIERLEAEGISATFLPGLGRDVSPLEDIRSFFILWHILENDRPNVFHANSSKMGGIGMLAARFARVKKIIFTAHGFAWSEDRPALQKFIIKFFVWITILLSHKTICVSEKTKKDVENFPFVKNKLVVVKNGLNPFPLLSREEARTRLNIADDELLIGTLSELHPIKGLDAALRGFKQFGEGKFVILGEGEERFPLESLIQDLGLEDKAFLKGFVPDAREYLSAFDIFTLTSRSENLPFALLEAGLAGLPVVATRVGGIPEIIKDGETGLLINPDNLSELRDALKKLTDKKLRETLGSNLEASVRANFSRQRMLEGTERAYGIYR